MGYYFSNSVAVELDFFQNVDEHNQDLKDHSNHSISVHAAEPPIVNNPNDDLYVVDNMINDAVPEMAQLPERSSQVSIRYNTTHLEVYLNDTRYILGRMDYTQYGAVDQLGYARIGFFGTTGEARCGKYINSADFYLYNVVGVSVTGLAPGYHLGELVTAVAQLIDSNQNNVNVDGTLKGVTVTCSTCSSVTCRVSNKFDGTYTITFPANYCNLTIELNGTPNGPGIPISIFSSLSPSISATGSTSASRTITSSRSITGTTSTSNTASPTITPSPSAYISLFILPPIPQPSFLPTPPQPSQIFPIDSSSPSTAANLASPEPSLLPEKTKVVLQSLTYNTCRNGACAEAQVTDSTTENVFAFETSSSQTVEVTLPPSSVSSEAVLSITETRLPTESNIMTPVIDISLFSSTGEVQPIASIEICFQLEAQKGQCLGFLNDAQKPPVWECEDRCLQTKGNFRCGKTDHLTNFAILLTGGTGDGGCGDDTDFMLENEKQDGILIASIVAAIWLVLLVCVLFLMTPQGRKVLYGKEGHRIAQLRADMKNISGKSST